MALNKWQKYIGEQYGGNPKSWPNSSLIREYLSMQKASFNIIFGHNAKVAQSLLADELHRRGIYEASNIFGPIRIVKWKGY